MKKLISKNPFKFIILGFLISFQLFSTLSAQQLQLELLNKYSLPTNSSIIESVAPDPKACFVDGSDFIYFNLSRVQNGFASSSLLGKIEAGQLSMLDTVDLPGWPDRLVGYYFDEDKNIYYCNQAIIGSTLRKMSAQGELLWENFDTTSSTYTPWYFFSAADGSPMMPARKNYPDGTFSYTLTKFSAATGEIIWESEFIEKGAPFYTPIYGKEYDDFFQVFVENNNEMNLARINKEGELIDLITKPNPMNEDILKYILMDSLGNTYTGLNAWGYRLPKLDQQLDTTWFYEKPSPFGDEIGNRTKNISIDGFENIYMSGPFRFEPKGKISLLLTKLNSHGELVWEQLTHNIEDNEKFFNHNTYIDNNKIWLSGRTIIDESIAYAAIYCFDLDGNLILNKNITEIGPNGYTAAMDFHEDEILITASSEYAPDSIFQHILHYRVDSVSATQNLPSQILVSPYPNPTSDYISIKDLNIQQIDQFTITDVQGKQMDANGIILKAGNIDLSRLANGIYFLSYFVNEQAYRAKVIKQ